MAKKSKRMNNGKTTKTDHFEITLSSHETFYSIAYRHHCRINQLVTERNKITVNDEKEVDLICKKNATIQRESMVVIIFSALTLEAFINYYGIIHFPCKYFEKHFDKLNPISKWVIIPRLVVGQQLDTSEKTYELLTRLFDLRNKLVHSKPTRKKINELTEEDWVTEKHAFDSMQAVNDSLKALKMLDSTVDIEWLRMAETDPYI